MAISGSLRQLRVSLAILVGLTFAGTLGLMVTGDRGLFDALYLTVVILTTVGMDASTTGADRAWALLLMTGGIGTVLYTTGQMVSFVVEGHLKQLIGRRKVTEHIHKLDGHWPDLELSRVSLSRFPGFTDHRLSDVYRMIGQRTIVVARIQSDGTRLLHPRSDTIVRHHDQLVVIGNTGCVHQMVEALTNPKAA